MIELRGVYKAFGEQRVLAGLDLTVEPGETLVILGRSGTGKSVTLKHVVGLLRPDSGSVQVDGIDVPSARGEALRRVRTLVAYLFQTGALVNWMSVRDNVALPLIERREQPRRAIHDQVDQALESLDMLHAADKLPGEISGGMRKRAALARVLVQRPRAILYDEPTAGLDPLMARTVAQLILGVQAEAERSAVVVTHDLELAFSVATRIGLHHEGRLVELADPETFRRSEHPVIRAFLDGGSDPTGAPPS